MPKEASKIWSKFAIEPVTASVLTGLQLANAASALAVVGAQTFSPKSAQTGALVRQEPGSPASGDHQLYRLSPGEFVNPRDQAQKVIDMQAAQKGYNTAKDLTDDDETDAEQQVMIGLQPDISDFIFAEHRENLALGTGVT